MNKEEAYFIPHCDFGECDLGTFRYKCPVCGKGVHDYEVWWKQDNLYCGIVVYFNCEECKEELKVKWDKKEHIFYVTKK